MAKSFFRSHFDLKQFFLTWVPFAFATTLFTFTLYAVVQQDLRQSANDPQIQMAEDTAALLNAGQDISTVLPSQGTAEVETSLAPYVIIYDKDGNVIDGTGYLNEQVAKIPAGIFQYVAAHGEDRVTWQPKPGVRSALVVTQFKNANASGFVVAGRSLREVERREDELGEEVFFGWMIVTWGLLGYFIFIENRKK